jgi:hypothetical protein
MTRVKRCSFEGFTEKHGVNCCIAFSSHPNTTSFERALCFLPRVIARARAAGREAIHEYHGCIDFCRLLAYREGDGFYAVSIAFDLRVRSLERPVPDLIL